MHGGPGAVFWCWITGLLGIATKYAEALLAVKYRVKGKHGEMHGGPMYAIEHGMHCRWLAVAFAIFTFLASFGIGCMVQSNAISTTAADTFGLPTQVTGLVLALLVASVVFFGVKGIGRVCVALVPFMALFYVSGCLLLLAINYEYVWPAIRCIVTSAFTGQAMEGGAIGSTLMLAMRFGIARGLFFNEAGLG
jgi:AGCS family alanine or glycine:cation symporter